MKTIDVLQTALSLSCLVLALVFWSSLYGKLGAFFQRVGRILSSVFKLTRIRVMVARSLVPELPVGDVERLVALYRILPEDERKVLDHIATRMYDVGLVSYGPMDIENDQRNMGSEEREELYDACVYRALGNLRRTQTKKGSLS